MFVTPPANKFSSSSIRAFSQQLAPPWCVWNSSSCTNRHALNECQVEGKAALLDCLQDHFHKLPSWLRLFVTTRPEDLIMNKLKEFKPMEIEWSDELNLEDLRLFFQEPLIRTMEPLMSMMRSKH